MRVISAAELGEMSSQVRDLQVFPENWTRYYTYTRFAHAPRSHSGLFIVCTDIHATFYEEGGNTVTATKGDVVYLPRGVHYRAEVPDGRDDQIDSYTLNFHLSDDAGDELLLADHICVLASRKDDVFAMRTEAVSRAFHQVESKNQLRLNAAWYHLLDAVVSASSARSAEYYPIRVGVEALRREWNENRKMDEYAAMCGVGSAYFYRLFRRWSGMSPVQYRNEMRLSNAETMLRHTDIQVGEIARTVGFADAFYFCRLFAKTYGLPPQKYRVAFRETEGNV